MDMLLKGWFTEFDPYERTRMIAEQEAKKNGEGNVKKTETKKVSTPTEDQVSMGEAWPGQGFSIRIDEVLFHGQSDYQDVLVAKTRNYGNMLVLDHVIQATERDEFMYQEMLTHLPLCSHPNPKKVLIIGGGDGGCVREALKHESVTSVTLCEIDNLVIEQCKKYLPSMADSLADPRVTVFVGDGFKFMNEHKNEFDVIITDSSDPIGPAESLFGKGYYELIRDALTENGVLASQAESIFLHLPLVKQLIAIGCTLFESVRYANGIVPTYPSGHIGYLICSKAKVDIAEPVRPISDEQATKMGLRYYDAGVHKAAFVLPRFAAKELGGK